MKRSFLFFAILFLVLLVASGEAFARDRHGRVVGRRPAAVKRIHSFHHHRHPSRYLAPRYHYSAPSYRYHRHYRSYAPVPRYYYCPPRRPMVRRSISVGASFSYRQSAPSYAVSDYQVGQYVGGGDYKFKFVGPGGRLCKAKVDDGFIVKIELD